MLLAGDAGVGKTRLLTELRDVALGEGWLVPGLTCSVSRVLTDQPRAANPTRPERPARPAQWPAMSDDDFRCSVGSSDAGEPLAGTAPIDAAFLFVEYPGAWGRRALEESRLPEAVKVHLDGLSGIRVQLIRRHRSTSGPGVRVFHAVASADGFAVRTTLLAEVDDLLDLDLASGLQDHHPPLWLVCTNGRRDRCCAEIGRPITTALAARWPAETWETTHLGGHRFSGTLLALPSGHTLGRLTVDNAVEACAEVEAGGVPIELSRGRAGRTGVEQVRELHVLAGGSPDVEIVEVPGPKRRQSCGDFKLKGTTRFEIVESEACTTTSARPPSC